MRNQPEDVLYIMFLNFVSEILHIIFSQRFSKDILL